MTDDQSRPATSICRRVEGSGRLSLEVNPLGLAATYSPSIPKTRHGLYDLGSISSTGLNVDHTSILKFDAGTDDGTNSVGAEPSFQIFLRQRGVDIKKWQRLRFYAGRDWRSVSFAIENSTLSGAVHAFLWISKAFSDVLEIRNMRLIDGRDGRPVRRMICPEGFRLARSWRHRSYKTASTTKTFGCCPTPPSEDISACLTMLN